MESGRSGQNAPIEADAPRTLAIPLTSKRSQCTRACDKALHAAAYTSCGHDMQRQSLCSLSQVSQSSCPFAGNLSTHTFVVVIPESIRAFRNSSSARFLASRSRARPIDAAQASRNAWTSFPGCCASVWALDPGSSNLYRRAWQSAMMLCSDIAVACMKGFVENFRSVASVFVAVPPPQAFCRRGSTSHAPHCPHVEGRIDRGPLETLTEASANKHQMRRGLNMIIIIPRSGPYLSMQRIPRTAQDRTPGLSGIPTHGQPCCTGSEKKCRRSAASATGPATTRVAQESITSQDGV